MRRKGGRIDSELEIERLHASLAAHFDGLRTARGNAPVYLIEHGLSGADLDAVLRSTRCCLCNHRIDGVWWSLHPLPLLVAATEIGYVYRGTGTDYWPIFAERLGDTSLADRAALSNLFHRTFERFGLAKPADTPWNQAFCHIAWPVLHAVLPIELHRPLARALRDARTHLDINGNDAALIVPVRNRARLVGGVRLIAWLEDQRTAAAVIRQFLDPSGEHAIASSALARIAADLARDETASEALRDARKRQKALEAQVPRRTQRKPVAATTRVAPIVLRLGDPLSLALKIPQLEPVTRDAARTALEAMRWRALLWGRGRPIPGRNIFSDYPVPFSVETLPPPDAVLLEGVASLPLSFEAKDFLSSLRVNTTAPILFSDFNADGDAIQQLSGTISEGGHYIVLTDQGHAPGSAVLLGRLAGLQVHRVDTGQVDGAAWVRQLGFAIRQSAQLTWVGAPEIENHRPTRRFRRGSYVAFEVAAVGGAAYVRIMAPDGARSELAGADRICAGLTADQLGTYVLHYGFEETSAFDVVEEDDDPALITVDIDIGAGSITDLADRQVTVRFDSEARLQETVVEFRFVCDGREAKCVSDTLPDTPCRVAGDHPIWDALLSPDTIERLLVSNTVDLGVSINGLVDASFRFERMTAPFVWQRDAAGIVAVDETGELDRFAMRPQKPLEVVRHDARHSGADIVLYRAGRRAPSLIGGLCIGPKIWRAGEVQVAQEPVRLLRQFQGGRNDMPGGRDVVEALIAWSGAGVDHPVTQFRRGQIVQQLERWLVQQLCGPRWANREAALARGSDASFASAFLNAAASLGIGYANITLPLASRHLLDRILLRLIEARGLQLSVQTCHEPISETLSAALDDLFNHAYVMLHDEFTAVGKRCPFDPDNDIDVGEASENWDRALGRAASQSALINLGELLRPLEAGDMLSLADFDTMLPDDNVELLHGWIRNHMPPHHSRNWSRELVEAAYWLLAKPAVAARLSWQAATERLLADSFSARAIRYVALRAAGGSRRSE